MMRCHSLSTRGFEDTTGTTAVLSFVAFSFDSSSQSHRAVRPSWTESEKSVINSDVCGSSRYTHTHTHVQYAAGAGTLLERLIFKLGLKLGLFLKTMVPKPFFETKCFQHLHFFSHHASSMTHARCHFKYVNVTSAGAEPARKGEEERARI